MRNEGLIHGEITEQVLGSCFEVYRVLGYGFLESVYRNAVAVELGRRGIATGREVPVEILYCGVSVGIYRIDLLVCESVILEVKSQAALTVADEKQLLNYLTASKLEVGLVFNFGPEPKFKRLVYSNSRK